MPSKVTATVKGEIDVTMTVSRQVIKDLYKYKYQCFGNNVLLEVRDPAYPDKEPGIIKVHVQVYVK